MLVSIIILMWVYCNIQFFLIIHVYCSLRTSCPYTYTSSTSNSASLGLTCWFDGIVLVMLIYLILIYLHRFSRSAGITNQGQDYNLDSSYYIIKGYRTISERMNSCTLLLLLAQNIYFLNVQRANSPHATRILLILLCSCNH